MSDEITHLYFSVCLHKASQYENKNIIWKIIDFMWDILNEIQHGDLL